MDVAEILATLWPLMALYVVVVAWAMIDLVRRKRVKALPKVIWGVLIVANLIGAIAYLALGRGDE